MFCKYCGETIDKKTMKCSACGKSVGPLAGGVGFWDLASQSAPAVPAVHGAEMRGPYGQGGQMHAGHPQTKQSVPKMVYILSILGAVLLLCLLVMNIKMWADIQTLKQNYENMLSEPTFLEQILGNITDKDPVEIDPQETAEVTTAPDNTPAPPIGEKPDWIREQPEDRVLSSEEIASRAPMVLFTLKADGKDLEFCWEKYDEKTEEWVKVDRRYEEEDKDTIGGEQSVLILEKWDEDVYGQYRCRVFDEKGNQIISDPVWLKPAEET